ncbi:MAG: hypothetical protein K2P78_08915 [Gemmataceae bacterium]|nr:hypothetical protein [Gemmataceae bacterium]
MTPDPLAITGAAARLDAAVRRLFHPDPFAFSVPLLVQVWDGEARRLRTPATPAAATWAALTGPDPLPEPLSVVVERVAGLDAIRRPLVELAGQVEQLRGVAGPAAVVVQLYDEPVGQGWGRAVVPDERDDDVIRVTDGGEEFWVYKSTVLFAPPNLHLLARLAEAVRDLPASAPAAAPTRRRPDATTARAVEQFEQLQGQGTSVRDAERIVCTRTGQQYAAGSLGRMLRRRRERLARKAADPKAA